MGFSRQGHWSGCHCLLCCESAAVDKMTWALTIQGDAESTELGRGPQGTLSSSSHWALTVADSFSASSRLIHSLTNFYRAPEQFASNQAGSRHIVGMIQTPKEFCVENDRVNKALLTVMVFQPQHYWHLAQGNSLLGERCSEGVSQHPWPRPTKCSCDTLAQLWQPQMSLDITKCLLGGKNHPWLKTTAI